MKKHLPSVDPIPDMSPTGLARNLAKSLIGWALDVQYMYFKVSRKIYKPPSIRYIDGSSPSGLARGLADALNDDWAVELRYQVGKRPYTGPGPPVVYINGHDLDDMSHNELAWTLADLLNDDWVQAVQYKYSSIGGKLPIPGFGEKLAFDLSREAPSLTEVLERYSILLERANAVGVKPILMIDEANVLMKLGNDPADAQLSQLFSFFVKINNQDHSAHVVLATSQYLLTYWLAEG